MRSYKRAAEAKAQEVLHTGMDTVLLIERVLLPTMFSLGKIEEEAFALS